MLRCYLVCIWHLGVVDWSIDWSPQVQEQNRQLKEALEKETSKPVVGSMAVSHDMLDFKKMFAETKAHAKVTLLPLRVFELVVS